jgi:hypothetical protein
MLKADVIETYVSKQLSRRKIGVVDFVFILEY